MWVGQQFQIDFTEGFHDPLDYQPTKYLRKHKSMQFAITLNVSINHINVQRLKVRQTIYLLEQAHPAPSSEAQWHSRTPRLCKEFIDFSWGIHKASKGNHAIQKPYQKLKIRFVKGAFFSAHLLEISNRNLEPIHRTTISQATRIGLDGRVV